MHLSHIQHIYERVWWTATQLCRPLITRMYIYGKEVNGCCDLLHEIITNTRRAVSWWQNNLTAHSALVKGAKFSTGCAKRAHAAGVCVYLYTAKGKMSMFYCLCGELRVCAVCAQKLILTGLTAPVENNWQRAKRWTRRSTVKEIFPIWHLFRKIKKTSCFSTQYKYAYLKKIA